MSEQLPELFAKTVSDLHKTESQLAAAQERIGELESIAQRAEKVIVSLEWALQKERVGGYYPNTTQEAMIVVRKIQALCPSEEKEKSDE